MPWAKQNTDATFIFGPVLAADGTMYSGALAYTDARIFKNGTDAALNASATFTHKYEGAFTLLLKAADLNTVGIAEVVLNKDPLSASPVKLCVLTANVYDSLFGNDLLDVNFAQILGTAIPAESQAGRDAAALGKLLDVASPVLTAESVNQGADNNTILANVSYGLSALKALIDLLTLESTSTAIKAKTDLIPASPATEASAGAAAASAASADSKATAIQAKTDLIPAAPATEGSAAAAAASAASADSKGTAIQAKTDLIPAAPATEGSAAASAASAASADSKASTIITNVAAVPAGVWAHATAVSLIASVGGIIAGVWAYATRTLTSLVGLGTRKVTITITDSVTGNPAPGLDVEIMDSTDTVCQWYGTTNASGVVLDGGGGYPYLNDAAYKVRATKPGSFTFTTQTMTVDSTHTTFAYTAVAFSPSAPPSSSTTVIYATIRYTDGTAYATKTDVITADIKDAPVVDADDVLWADVQRTGDTDVNGYCYVVIPRLAASRVQIRIAKLDMEITPTAAQESINLGTLVV